MIHSLRRFLCLTIVMVLSFSAAGNSPEITFSRTGVKLGGFAPGRKVAWLGVVRERMRHHSGVRSLSGMEPARADGAVSVLFPKADESHGVWVAVEIETGAAARKAAPRYDVSTTPIEIAAVAQASSILVRSARIALLWVRPNGGAWTLSAYDGGAWDADLVADGTITIDLQSMRRVQGNPHPSVSLSARDVIVAIDPSGLRSTVLEVAQ